MSPWCSKVLYCDKFTQIGCYQRERSAFIRLMTYSHVREFTLSSNKVEKSHLAISRSRNSISFFKAHALFLTYTTGNYA